MKCLDEVSVWQRQGMEQVCTRVCVFIRTTIKKKTPTVLILWRCQNSTLIFDKKNYTMYDLKSTANTDNLKGKKPNNYWHSTQAGFWKIQSERENNRSVQSQRGRFLCIYIHCISSVRFILRLQLHIIQGSEWIQERRRGNTAKKKWKRKDAICCNHYHFPTAQYITI